MAAGQRASRHLKRFCRSLALPGHPGRRANGPPRLQWPTLHACRPAPCRQRLRLQPRCLPTPWPRTINTVPVSVGCIRKNRFDDEFTRRPGMVRQHPRRRARRPGRRAGADPGSHRVLDHRRRRPQGRPVRVVLDRRGHRVRRRPARHDFRRHRRDGAGDGHPGQGSRPAIPAGGHRADRRAADRRRRAQAGQPDAVRLALGDHRLRQCAGDPDLHGAIAGTGQRAMDGVCDDRGGTRHHLSVSAT